MFTYPACLRIILKSNWARGSLLESLSLNYMFPDQDAPPDQHGKWPIEDFISSYEFFLAQQNLVLNDLDEACSEASTHSDHQPKPDIGESPDQFRNGLSGSVSPTCVRGDDHDIMSSNSPKKINATVIKCRLMWLIFLIQ